METKDIGESKDSLNRLNEKMIKDLEKMFRENKGAMTDKEKELILMINNQLSINTQLEVRYMLNNTTGIIVGKIKEVKDDVRLVKDDIRDIKNIIGNGNNGITRKS